MSLVSGPLSVAKRQKSEVRDQRTEERISDWDLEFRNERLVNGLLGLYNLDGFNDLNSPVSPGGEADGGQAA